jgi:hypothetical protein
LTAGQWLRNHCQHYDGYKEATMHGDRGTHESAEREEVRATVFARLAARQALLDEFDARRLAAAMAALPDDRDPPLRDVTHERRRVAIARWLVRRLA